MSNQGKVFKMDKIKLAILVGASVVLSGCSVSNTSGPLNVQGSTNHDAVKACVLEDDARVENSQLPDFFAYTDVTHYQNGKMSMVTEFGNKNRREEGTLYGQAFLMNCADRSFADISYDLYNPEDRLRFQTFRRQLRVSAGTDQNNFDDMVSSVKSDGAIVDEGVPFSEGNTSFLNCLCATGN